MIVVEVADDFINYDEHVVTWLVHALKVLQEQSFTPGMTEAGVSDPTPVAIPAISD
jgi:hypothetical protein